LASPVWGDEALVFTTGIGTPLEPRDVLRSCHELCERAEVRRVRIHDLRHAAASFMVLQGVDVRLCCALGRIRTQAPSATDLRETLRARRLSATRAYSDDRVMDRRCPALRQRRRTP
jgi:integrase